MSGCGSDEEVQRDLVLGRGAGREFLMAQKRERRQREMAGIRSERCSRGESMAFEHMAESMGISQRSLCERLVISPGNKVKLVFDVIVLSSIVYTAIAMPVKVSIRVEFADGLDALVDFLFWIDVVLQVSPRRP